ncbi:MAG: ribose 5-phosphate isomerase B [Clostridiaceae bacterium]|jgi:ribose 5-phosphate isomerase B|nr:ribose 5-phosphate isomerase B [Clostridiaceae bacterium]
MKVALGNDHGGYVLREAVLETLKKNKIEVTDFGTFTADSCDYPEYGLRVAEGVAEGKFDFGILLCGTGIGISIAANKVKGIRAATVTDAFCAEACKKHNNANVIAMGGRIITPEQAKTVLQAYIDAGFEGGRHEKRVRQIADIEAKYFK